MRENKHDWNLVQKGLPALNKCDQCKEYFKTDAV